MMYQVVGGYARYNRWKALCHSEYDDIDAAVRAALRHPDDVIVIYKQTGDIVYDPVEEDARLMLEQKASAA